MIEIEFKDYIKHNTIDPQGLVCFSKLISTKGFIEQPTGNDFMKCLIKKKGEVYQTEWENGESLGSTTKTNLMIMI
jgi:hypothetical protein